MHDCWRPKSCLILLALVFNLFVFLQISELSSVILISIRTGAHRQALSTSYNYFIGADGVNFSIFGIGFVHAINGTVNRADLSKCIKVHRWYCRLCNSLCWAWLYDHSYDCQVDSILGPCRYWLCVICGNLSASITTKGAPSFMAGSLLTLFADNHWLVFLLVRWWWLIKIYHIMLSHSSVSKLMISGLTSSVSVVASSILAVMSLSEKICLWCWHFV